MPFAAIEIGPIMLKVSPSLDKDVFDRVREATRFKVDGCQFTPQFRTGGWDGYIQNFYKNQTAPSGLYLRIKRCLEREGYKVEYGFNNDYAPKGKIQVHGLILAPFQIELVKAGVKYRFCIMSAAIRGGKTAVMSAIANYIDHYPICVITKRKDLTKQTADAIASHTQKAIGVFSESKYTSGDIWVTSYEAIAVLYRWFRNQKEHKNIKVSEKIQKRNEEILEQVRKVKVLLLDECQYALTENVRSAIGLFSSIGYKIGLSGTPRTDSKRQIQIEAAIGSLVKKVNIEKLITIGRLAKPRVIVYDLPWSWFDFTLGEFGDIYKCNIADNYNRNCFIAEIVYNLHKLNKSSFVMVNRIEHGNNLCKLIPNSFFVRGNTETSVRFGIYNALQNNKIACIIGTVGKVGLNLPRLDAVINAEGLQEQSMTIQKMRSLTAFEGKNHGFVIDFVDKGKFLFSHSRSRLRTYYSLKGFDVSIKRVLHNHFGRSDHEKIAV